MTTGRVEGKGISAKSVSSSSTSDPVSASSSVSSSGSPDSEETSKRNECVTSSDSSSARTVSSPTSPSSGETSTNEGLVDNEVISYWGSFTCGSSDVLPLLGTGLPSTGTSTMLSVTDPGSFGGSDALVGVERSVVDGVTGVTSKDRRQTFARVPPSL